ncbi:transporter substrate-binding domain-containing protein [Pararobbsia silviterrae]|nr:transporter substrate-binding domain-containing protein [Pararobbsia silviterrae]
MALAAADTASPSAAQPGNAPLRVAIAADAPFVLPGTAAPQGFSIDLWNEVARRMGVQFTWIRVPTDAALLTAVQHGDADIAISAITITPEREHTVDFSMPYFDSGLQIMARAHSENSLVASLLSVPWLPVVELLIGAVIVVLILAHVVWLTERKRDPHFPKPYVRALGEGLWITMLIIATGEHGERDAPGVWKRVLVPTMWIIGVVLIAQLTATVTSSQTVARLRSDIGGPDDLPGKKIGTVPGTVAADYLTERGLPFFKVSTAADGLRMLTNGDLQAIVYDAPTLRYWAAKRGNGVLAVVGPVFRPSKYGIAVANGSRLRKTINEALITMYDDGTYDHIYGKWFSTNK